MGTHVEPEKRHLDQFGVEDDLATAEQLASRHAGVYDPRPASGEFVAVRVKLLCVRCGKHLGEVAEFEKRVLWHSIREGKWTRGPSGLKCKDCFPPLEEFPVDMYLVEATIEKAKRGKGSRTLKIGSRPAKLT